MRDDEFSSVDGEETDQLLPAQLLAAITQIKHLSTDHQIQILKVIFMKSKTDLCQVNS